MKHCCFQKHLLPILLSLLMLVLSACAQPPPEINETETPTHVQIRTPHNPDGTCYTQSVLLPTEVSTDTLIPPRFTVVGETLVLTGAIPDTHTALIWDLGSNLLYPEPLTPMVEIPDSDVYLRTHIPLSDGGAIQLLEIHSYPNPENPEDLVTSDTLLLAADAGGNIRFTQSVSALFNDGYTHMVHLHRDDKTGYLYLSEPEIQILILDSDASVLDCLPWIKTENASGILVNGEGGSVWFADRRTDIAEWAYYRYDPAAHAFAKASEPLWSGYRMHPSDNRAWFEHTPEGFVKRHAGDDGTVSETLLVNWVRSGFTDASIRETYVACDSDGSARVYALTKNFDTGAVSLTLFDPYAAYTAPQKHELHLYAEETVHTLQETVVAFNTDNGLYRIVYTDDPSESDLLFVGRFWPVPDGMAVLDLNSYLNSDTVIDREALVPGILSAFESEDDALNVFCLRAAVQLDEAPTEEKTYPYIRSAAEYLISVLSHDLFPEQASVEPVLGFAIPTSAADPDGAWKFIRFALRTETAETLRSGANEGFSVINELLSGQLDAMYGAYAVRHGHQISFAYPKDQDPETFDPMTNANFADAAKQEGAYYVRFDRDQRAVLEGFLGVKQTDAN
ncbi:MAG: hypothetical protein E7604_03490 [Ruminococcaceae bacterium]|nr:hypothetical protein [Oscillospiraceae bacterium]